MFSVSESMGHDSENKFNKINNDFGSKHESVFPPNILVSVVLC